MTEVEKDKVRLEFDRMMEEGRGRTILEGKGAEMERNGSGEGMTTKSRTSSEIMTSGRAESVTRWQEHLGEERS